MMQSLLFEDGPSIASPRYATEEWADIPFAPGYAASSHGRFRNKAADVELKGSKNHNGYIHVGFTIKGKQVFYLAHRVIAETFLPKPQSPHYLIVNHKDRIRGNNAVCNLEWCTVASNASHWRRGVTLQLTAI